MRNARKSTEISDTERTRGSRRYGTFLSAGVAAALLGSGLVPVLAPAAAAAAASPGAAAASTVSCTSSAHRALAAKLARDIQAARHGRLSTVALWFNAPEDGLTCTLSGSSHFDSASIVKVTILGALLRKALDQHRYLTSTEDAEAWGMITQSNNDDASALWYELGHSYLQHFLNLAGMRQTYLGPGGYWGLTQVTAHDETLLLQLLVTRNKVLSNASRAYALDLMAQVVSYERWGVPAGTPRGVAVHVKNGWLPRATHGWRIHSIGAFTWPKGWYTIVVLTQDNPTEDYGIATIEGIARVIHRDLNPTAPSAIPLSAPNRLWGTPDEQIPPLTSIP
jgi:Beta-lactamase enzyme family